MKKLIAIILLACSTSYVYADSALHESSAATQGTEVTNPEACHNKLLYISTYGELQRRSANKLGAIILGGIVQTVEDLWQKDHFHGRPYRENVRQPIIYFHNTEDATCASALAEALKKIRTDDGSEIVIKPLPQQIKPQIATVELLLPPTWRTDLK